MKINSLHIEILRHIISTSRKIIVMLIIVILSLLYWGCNKSSQEITESQAPHLSHSSDSVKSIGTFDSIVDIQLKFKCGDGAGSMADLHECYLKEREFLLAEITKQFQLVRQSITDKELLKKLDHYHASWLKHLEFERDFTSSYYEDIYSGTRSTYDIREHFLNTYKSKLEEYITLDEAWKEKN